MVPKADSALGRIASAARPGRPLFRITASPWWARVLIAAGAQEAPSADSMVVVFPANAEGASLHQGDQDEDEAATRNLKEAAAQARQHLERIQTEVAVLTRQRDELITQIRRLRREATPITQDVGAQTSDSDLPGGAVRDGMSRLVLTIGPVHTLREAARLMSARRVGAAVVIDSEHDGGER